MTTYDLGLLVGGYIHQYANAVGQSYYRNTKTNETSYAIPLGFEDSPNDTWTLDGSKTWPQWKNSRTGRATLIDPNPPPPQTYLDDNNVKAALDLLRRVPESDEHVYRRPIGAILRFLFTAAEGYDVVQEAEGDVSRADWCVFKVLRKPGGTLFQYDFMLAESKPVGESWRTTEIQHREQVAGNGNDSKNCYGMIHIGLEIQFYKFEGQELEKVGGKMHLVNHAKDIVAWGQYLKKNPLAFV